MKNKVNKMTQIKGKDIKSFRKDNGLTQANLASALNISKDAVINWERPENKNQVIGGATRRLIEELFPPTPKHKREGK